MLKNSQHNLSSFEVLGITVYTVNYQKFSQFKSTVYFYFKGCWVVFSFLFKV